MFRRSLAPHIQACIHYYDYTQGDVREDDSIYWNALILILSGNGLTSKAIELEEPLSKLRKIKLGADHPDTLSSMNNLAIGYSEAGRRDEACS